MYSSYMHHTFNSARGLYGNPTYGTKHGVVSSNLSGKLINRLVTPVPSELADGSQAIDDTRTAWQAVDGSFLTGPVRMALFTEIYRGLFGLEFAPLQTANQQPSQPDPAPGYGAASSPGANESQNSPDTATP